MQIILDGYLIVMVVHDSPARFKGGTESKAITVDDEDHYKRNIPKDGVKKIGFFLPTCSACRYEVKFSEGDVIYGDKWYHRACWKEIQTLAELVS